MHSQLARPEGCLREVRPPMERSGRLVSCSCEYLDPRRCADARDLMAVACDCSCHIHCPICGHRAATVSSEICSNICHDSSAKEVHAAIGAYQNMDLFG